MKVALVKNEGIPIEGREKGSKGDLYNIPVHIFCICQVMDLMTDNAYSIESSTIYLHSF